jgi:hypothetical protein
MIGSLQTSQIHCWWHTGNVDLMSKTGNAPTGSALLQQKLIHVADLSCRTSSTDEQNHRIEQTISSEHTSNPHSSVETAQQHLPRPRGFLP